MWFFIIVIIGEFVKVLECGGFIWIECWRVRSLGIIVIDRSGNLADLVWGYSGVEIGFVDMR